MSKRRLVLDDDSDQDEESYIIDDQSDDGESDSSDDSAAAKKRQKVAHTSTSTAPAQSLQKGEFSRIYEEENEKVLKRVLSFLSQQELLLRVACVSSRCCVLAKRSLYSLRVDRSLRDTQNQEDLRNIITNTIAKAQSLHTLIISGWWMELSSEMLQLLLSNCPSSLRQLQIDCVSEITHVVISGEEHANLDNVTTLYLGNLKGTTLRNVKVSGLKNLTQLRFWYIDFPPLAPFVFQDLPALTLISFYGCSKLTDRTLIGMLKQFDDTIVRKMRDIMQECDITSESQALRYMGVASQSSQMEDIPVQANDVEVESRMLLEVTQETEIWRASDVLKVLLLQECEAIINPIIAVASLEEIDISHCRDLQQPLIVNAEHLRTLFVRKCPQLQSLMLSKSKSSVPLKEVNLSGSGTDCADDVSLVRKNIASALREYLGDQVRLTF